MDLPSTTLRLSSGYQLRPSDISSCSLHASGDPRTALPGVMQVEVSPSTIIVNQTPLQQVSNCPGSEVDLTADTLLSELF